MGDREQTDEAGYLEGDETPLNTSTSSESPSKATGYWWHVNKSGFPISEETWSKMWQHIADVHPDAAQISASIRGQTSLKGVPPIPSCPSINPAHSVHHNLLLVQNYMNELQYNHTGTQFFDIKKSRPLSRLMEIAKEMIQECLPIKCLEAVILSLYLTSPMLNTQRIAVGFKSKFEGMYFRHVVLVVQHGGLYGALGLSRRKDLMYKPLVFRSLADLMEDFIQSYRNYHHQVVKVKMSKPIVHDVTSCEPINWKVLLLNLTELTDENARKAMEKFSRTIRSLQSC